MNNEQEITELPDEDIAGIWQLACVLTPHLKCDFVEAFREAAFQRTRLLIAAREAKGGLRISPEGTKPVQRIIHGADGQWRLVRDAIE